MLCGAATEQPVKLASTRTTTSGWDDWAEQRWVQTTGRASLYFRRKKTKKNWYWCYNAKTGQNCSTCGCIILRAQSSSLPYVVVLKLLIGGIGSNLPLPNASDCDTDNYKYYDKEVNCNNWWINNVYSLWYSTRGEALKDKITWHNHLYYFISLVAKLTTIVLAYYSQ